MKRVYVWTLPSRLFHALLVSLIVGVWIASLESRWLSWHVALGSGIALLLLFRIIWGVMGPKYSRFSDFEFKISRLKEYLLTIFHPSRHFVGHNPAASYVMIAILITIALAVISGMVAYGVTENRGILSLLHAGQFRNMKLFEEMHELFVNLLWVLIGAHIAGVLADRFLHSSNGILTSIVGGHKNFEGENAVLSFFQKVVATMGVGGSVALLIYTISVPDNFLIVGNNKKIDYKKVNPLFAKECGSCHTLYPPTLLPRESWRVMMGDLENHFGDDASLDSADNKSISDYLFANSAETSTQEMSVKIMDSMHNRNIIAITQTPFWKKSHKSISPEVFKSSEIKRRSNCKACHSDVEQGTIEDSSIKIKGK